MHVLDKRSVDRLENHHMSVKKWLLFLRNILYHNCQLIIAGISPDFHFNYYLIKVIIIQTQTYLRYFFCLESYPVSILLDTYSVSYWTIVLVIVKTNVNWWYSRLHMYSVQWLSLLDVYLYPMILKLVDIKTELPTCAQQYRNSRIINVLIEVASLTTIQ